MPDVAIPKGFRYAILAPAFERGQGSGYSAKQPGTSVVILDITRYFG